MINHKGGASEGGGFLIPNTYVRSGQMLTRKLFAVANLLVVKFTLTEKLQVCHKYLN